MKDNDNSPLMHKKPPGFTTLKNKINTSKEFLHPLVIASWTKEEKDFQNKEKAKENKKSNNSKTSMAQSFKVTVNLQKMAKEAISKN